MLKRWDGFAQFVDEGRICLTNNAADGACADWLRAERPGCSLDPTAARQGRHHVHPHHDRAHQRRRSQVRRIVEITQFHLHELLPWEWKAKPKM
ncbi:hypothetical protein IVB27_35715 [Bradyrhizobium sp. 197]|nr:hypothetical protein [Bradyrhizobium sp. 197]